MYWYGQQLNKNTTADRLIKFKNRSIYRHHSALLKYYGRLPHPSLVSALIATVARKVIGSFIYSLKIELNDFCNLKCKMCYVPGGEHRSLPREAVIDLLNQIKGLGVRVELLGGEPLMYDDLPDLIRYAKEKAKVPYLTVYTNGTQLDKKTARQLKTAGTDALLVTLVSHKETVHDNFTGVQGSWEKTNQGIREALKAGISTYTFTAIHRENYKDFKEIYAYVKKELQAHALFYQYIPQKADDPLLIDKLEWHKIKRTVITDFSPKHMEFVRNFYMLTGNACSGGNFVFTVKADGSVQPCPFIADLPLGNIFKNNIWEIYKKRFTGTGLKEFKSVPEECKECVYMSICGGGCKAGYMGMKEDYRCKDHRCLGPFAKHKSKDEVLIDIPTFF